MSSSTPATNTNVIGGPASSLYNSKYTILNENKNNLKSLDELPKYFYLNNKNDNRDSLLNHGCYELIIRRMTTNQNGGDIGHYIGFKSYKELREYDLTGENLHEVILEGQPRHPFVDIDINACDIIFSEEESDKLKEYKSDYEYNTKEEIQSDHAKSVLNNVKAAIMVTIKKYCTDDLTPNNYLDIKLSVFSRHRPGKFSYHVICTSHTLEHLSCFYTQVIIIPTI